MFTRLHTSLGYVANYTHREKTSHTQKNLWPRKNWEKKCLKITTSLNKRKENSVYFSTSADSAVRVDPWLALFPWQIELELHVWLKQEIDKGQSRELGHSKDLVYIIILTYLEKKLLCTMSWSCRENDYYSKYPLEIPSRNGPNCPCMQRKQTIHCDIVSTCYIQMTSPRHNACMHTKKWWENIFLLIHCAQTTENISLI